MVRDTEGELKEAMLLESEVWSFLQSCFKVSTKLKVHELPLSASAIMNNLIHVSRTRSASYTIIITRDMSRCTYLL